MPNYKNEKEYIKNYNSNEFEKVSLTTDLLIFGIADVDLQNYRKLAKKVMRIYLIKRDNFPHKGKWALPGGFVDTKETLSQRAINVLHQKTQLKDLYLEQLYTFDDIKRDPRMRILSVAYMALLDCQKLSNEIQKNENWFDIITENDEIYLQNSLNKDIKINLKNENELAFDHAKMIDLALTRLKNKIEYTDLAFEFLPNEFTLTQLQNVYEIILRKKLLPAAFRRIIAPKVEKTNKITEGFGHRPSAFFQKKK